MGRISTTLVAGFLCLCLTATLEAQGEFSYGFEDVPENIQAETGTTVPFQVKLVLGSSGLDATGPQGWSLGVANNGVNITALTTAGSAAADVADETRRLNAALPAACAARITSGSAFTAA